MSNHAGFVVVVCFITHFYLASGRYFLASGILLGILSGTNGYIFPCFFFSFFSFSRCLHFNIGLLLMWHKIPFTYLLLYKGDAYITCIPYNSLTVALKETVGSSVRV